VGKRQAIKIKIMSKSMSIRVGIDRDAEGEGSVGARGRGSVSQSGFDAAPTFRVAHFFDGGKGFDQAGGK